MPLDRCQTAETSRMKDPSQPPLPRVRQGPSTCFPQWSREDLGIRRKGVLSSCSSRGTGRLLAGWRQHFSPCVALPPPCVAFPPSLVPFHEQPPSTARKAQFYPIYPYRETSRIRRNCLPTE